MTLLLTQPSSMGLVGNGHRESEGLMGIWGAKPIERPVLTP